MAQHPAPAAVALPRRRPAPRQPGGRDGRPASRRPRRRAVPPRKSSRGTGRSRPRGPRRRGARSTGRGLAGWPARQPVHQRAAGGEACTGRIREPAGACRRRQPPTPARGQRSRSAGRRDPVPRVPRPAAGYGEPGRTASLATATAWLRRLRARAATLPTARAAPATATHLAAARRLRRVRRTTSLTGPARRAAGIATPAPARAGRRPGRRIRMTLTPPSPRAHRQPPYGEPGYSDGPATPGPRDPGGPAYTGTPGYRRRTWLLKSAGPPRRAGLRPEPGGLRGPRSVIRSPATISGGPGYQDADWLSRPEPASWGSDDQSSAWPSSAPQGGWPQDYQQQPWAGEGDELESLPPADEVHHDWPGRDDRPARGWPAPGRDGEGEAW